VQLNYRTELPYRKPVGGQDRANAATAFASAPQHSQYGSSYGDLSKAYSAENAANFQKGANLANYGYQSAFDQAQQDLSLRGLTAMAQSQDQQRQIEMARLRNMNTLLSGLMG
jgi:hypothetical protein